jgi:hypothetical protein
MSESSATPENAIPTQQSSPDNPTPSQEVNPREKVNQFISKVRASMTPAEISRLPSETFAYVNSFTGKALDNVDEFGTDLKDLVVSNYHNSPFGERFIYDPRRDGTLFVDGDGELVSLRGAEIATFQKGSQVEGQRYIKVFDTYDVLTGPNKGKSFGREERPIPAPKKPTPPQQ